MTYTLTCPRCGQDVVGADRGEVADAVVLHAAIAHRHTLDRDIALAHIEDVHPYDRDG
jgi:predicted small metal-binding protein